MAVKGSDYDQRKMNCEELLSLVLEEELAGRSNQEYLQQQEACFDQLANLNKILLCLKETDKRGKTYSLESHMAET